MNTFQLLMSHQHVWFGISVIVISITACFISYLNRGKQSKTSNVRFIEAGEYLIPLDRIISIQSIEYEDVDSGEPCEKFVFRMEDKSSIELYLCYADVCDFEAIKALAETLAKHTDVKIREFK